MRAPFSSRSTDEGEAMAIAEHLLLPVVDVPTAKAYLTALVENGQDFDLTEDPMEYAPKLFNHDEALIIADRIKRMHDHLDELHDSGPMYYLCVAVARKLWAQKTDEQKQCAFELFELNVLELTNADMVALLEWKDPKGAYDDLSLAKLMTLMEQLG